MACVPVHYRYITGSLPAGSPCACRAQTVYLRVGWLGGAARDGSVIRARVFERRTPRLSSDWTDRVMSSPRLFFKKVVKVILFIYI